jgi:hypothetical protein
MIRMKNMAEYHEPVVRAGLAAVAATFYELGVPANGFIKSIVASFGLIGTDGTGAPTQDVIVDILKNGVSIFSGAVKINFSHAKQVGGANTPINADNYGALTTNPVPVNKGDRLQFSITQILNGTTPTQPSDLTIWLVFTRGQGWAPEATLEGQFCELDS